MELKYLITKKDTNFSINTILKNNLQISTRLLSKLIKNKSIYLNGKICDTRNFAFVNDVLIVNFDARENNSNIIPLKMDLNIVYEDEWLLVINKPSGIPIHPSRIHYSNSLSNGIKFYFDSIGLHKKIRPVNRLDLDTSGLVIFAKCEYIQEALIKQMNKKIFKKEYLCLVNGFLEKKIGTINLPIARKSGSIIERCIDTKNGRPSITHYEVLQEFNIVKNNNSIKYSLVKCILETGRTHQIRVHMSAIGHPILGDTLYSTKSDLIDHQALHSYKIQFIHPVTKKILEIKDIPNFFS